MEKKKDLVFEMMKQKKQATAATCRRFLEGTTISNLYNFLASTLGSSLARGFRATRRRGNNEKSPGAGARYSPPSLRNRSPKKGVYCKAANTLRQRPFKDVLDSWWYSSSPDFVLTTNCFNEDESAKISNLKEISLKRFSPFKNFLGFSSPWGSSALPHV